MPSTFARFVLGVHVPCFLFDASLALLRSLLPFFLSFIPGSGWEKGAYDAAHTEALGIGTNGHVVNSEGQHITTVQLEELVKAAGGKSGVKVWHCGTNSLNCDELEKACHRRLMDVHLG